MNTIGNTKIIYGDIALSIMVTVQADKISKCEENLNEVDALIAQIGAALDIKQVDTAKQIINDYLDGQEFKKGVGDKC